MSNTEQVGSATISAAGPEAQRVASLRRGLGVTRKEFGAMIGASLNDVERLEAGELDPDPYLPSIERVAGKKLGSDGIEASEADGAAAVPERSETGRAMPVGVLAVLAGITALVTVRFFTEVVPVLPRAANFVDIPMLGALVCFAFASSRGVELRRRDKALLIAGTAFLLLGIVATLTNLGRISVAPALVFFYGTLGPLAVYFCVLRVWSPGYANAIAKLLLGLGVLQILVVIAIDVPTFIESNNPDDISGTFGENPYQLVFFLLLFCGLLAGTYLSQPGSLAARFAPALVLCSLGVIVLAQYRSLLLTTALSLVLITLIAGRSEGRGRMLGAVAITGLLAALALGAQHVPILKIQDTADEGATSLLTNRLEVFGQLNDLYSDEPDFIVTGTGPGTYSSRAWQTFALAGSSSDSNVAGGYALRFTGGEPYDTDVSEEYVRPRLRHAEAVAGSSAVNSPLCEYVAIAAETGLLGLAAFLLIYGIAFASVLRDTLRLTARPSRGDPLAGLLIACTVGFFVLIQMGILQNWLEVTRLTFPLWTLLAIATVEARSRLKAPA